MNRTDVWRELLEIEKECPELAYVVREAAENNAPVSEGFHAMGGSLAESCRDFLRALDQGVSRDFLSLAEKQGILAAFWREIKHHE